MRPTAALALLMRWPRPGEGKTRLAAQVGVPVAHRLHAAFVADTLAWPWPRPRLLAVSPDDDAVDAARVVAPDAVVMRQADGDLGTRIAALLEAALAHGDVAVLVGTDSPSLPAELLHDCVDAARGGAATVPAEDGGFVALAVDGGAAARCGLDWLRDGDIAWSTAHTAAQTVAAAWRCGLRVHRTVPWYDVDGAADLYRLHRDLRTGRGRAPATLGTLDALAFPGVAAAELAS